MARDTSRSTKGHAHSRLAVRWPVLILAPQAQIKGESENINLTGVLISCEQAPPTEGCFRMLLSPPERHPLEITARAAWTTLFHSEDGTTRLGVDAQFVAIADTDLHFLHTVVSGKVAREIRSEEPLQVLAITPCEEELPEPRYENVPVKINVPLHLGDLAQALGTGFDVLKELNPDLAGYYLRAGQHRIRVPVGLGIKVPSALGHLTRQVSRRRERRASCHYVVQFGDTAREIARKTGVPLAVLIRLNDLDGRAVIVGQKLRLPRGKTC
ncbi:MAG TPA: LysM peptidoglycan-binding domain-containing protein [Syntrophobacteria bacterium]|nr:LysM peptidoglycan-binding domain-containing protein [Syntrophobacteria bacterium]